MHVLIVEENIPLATRIGDTIEMAGDEPDYADDEALALRLCRMNRYDVIVLGSTSPQKNPHQICAAMAQSSGRRTPVLALTSAACDPDPEFGPHDIACPSSNARTLHARLKTLMTESGCGALQLTAGELHMDLEASCVYYGQVPIDLAPISFRILELLIRAFPGVVTRAYIEKHIWDNNPPESGAALRGHIHRLRQLLERPTARQMIRTVHGVGYQLESS